MSGVSGAPLQQRPLRTDYNVSPPEKVSRREWKQMQQRNKELADKSLAVLRRRERELEQAERDLMRAREDYGRLMAVQGQEASPAAKAGASNLQRTDPQQEYWKPNTALRIGDSYGDVPDELKSFQEYQDELRDRQYEQQQPQFGDDVPLPDPRQPYTTVAPPAGVLGSPGMGMLAVAQEDVDDKNRV